MSIRAKILSCFVVVLCLSTGVSIYSYTRARQSNERLALVNELFLPLSRQIAQLQTNTQGLAEDIRRFYFQAAATADGSTFSRMVRDLYPYLIRKKLSAAEHLVTNRDRESELGPVPGELAALLQQAHTHFDAMSTANDLAAFEASYKKLRLDLETLSRRVDDECQKVTLTAQGEGKDNLIMSLLLSMFVVLFGAATILFSHRALAPLPTLIQYIKKITDGDFNQSLKVNASDKDEIFLLAREYNRMLGALTERDKKIQLQQKELLQAERLAAVGQLSAEVVHEIRNPLNAISLNIDWLENELEGSDAEIAKTLKSVSREVSRLHQITESYLVRARMPAPEASQTSVHEVIRELLEFSREEDKAHRIEVRTEFASQDIYVRTDRSRLKQALLNVLRNAKEAMPQGGVIRLRTEVRDNVYRILVEDSGSGMNESTRARTFHPFFTTKPNGTGLGLMLTREIVEEAHGAVHCESRLGEGTTFTFQFPA